MNELNDLSDLIDTLKGRVQRLAELQVSIDIFEDPYVIGASRNLGRLSTQITSQLRDVERAALASL
jgi:hypothetical protein